MGLPRKGAFQYAVIAFIPLDGFNVVARPNQFSYF
jgi:hypothetical protein